MILCRETREQQEVPWRNTKKGLMGLLEYLVHPANPRDMNGPRVLGWTIVGPAPLLEDINDMLIGRM